MAWMAPDARPVSIAVEGAGAAPHFSVAAAVPRAGAGARVNVGLTSISLGGRIGVADRALEMEKRLARRARWLGLT